MAQYDCSGVTLCDWQEVKIQILTIVAFVVIINLWLTQTGGVELLAEREVKWLRNYQ